MSQYYTKVVALAMQMLDRKPSEEPDYDRGGGRLGIRSRVLTCLVLQLNDQA